jgi:hypothetical protein
MRAPLMPSRSRLTTESDEASLRAERDGLKWTLQEKANIAAGLETRLTQFADFKQLLMKLMQELQETQSLVFVDSPSSWERRCKSNDDIVNVLRSGIDKFIAKHTTLATRYEREFTKHLFGLHQQVATAQETLERQKQRVIDSQRDCSALENLLALVQREKKSLKRTIQYRRSTLSRHTDASARERAHIAQQLNQAQASLESAIATNQDNQRTEMEIQRKIQERAEMETARAEMHVDLVKAVEEMRADIQRESLRHNETGAALTRARDELVRLTRSVDSHVDNLKTQELLNEENENKRLRSVLNIEKAEFEDKFARQVQKGTEMQEAIAGLQEEIIGLNREISAVEHRWQIQLTRIPDFKQLHQALDRERAAGKKQKAFVRARQEVFDDFQQNAKRVREDNEEAARARAEFLTATMPTRDEELAMEDVKFIGSIKEHKLSNAFDELLFIGQTKV